MKFDIVTYGNAALREKATPVTRFDDALKKLARDMLDSMYAANGLGLAAEQIGQHLALFVIDIPADMDKDAEGQRENPDIRQPLVMINPEITESRGHTVAQEGCLSFPEIFVKIKRAAEVVVKFQDVDGTPRTLRTRGLMARAVQHELDHLNGVLLVDRMSPVQKVTNAGKLKKLKQKATTVSVA